MISRLEFITLRKEVKKLKKQVKTLAKNYDASHSIVESNNDYLNKAFSDKLAAFDKNTLVDLGQKLAHEINNTPTGELRELLTDINILLKNYNIIR